MENPKVCGSCATEQLWRNLYIVKKHIWFTWNINQCVEQLTKKLKERDGTMYNMRGLHRIKGSFGKELLKVFVADSHPYDIDDVGVSGHGNQK